MSACQLLISTMRGHKTLNVQPRDENSKPVDQNIYIQNFYFVRFLLIVKFIKKINFIF